MNWTQSKFTDHIEDCIQIKFMPWLHVMESSSCLWTGWKYLRYVASNWQRGFARDIFCQCSSGSLDTNHDKYCKILPTWSPHEAHIYHNRILIDHEKSRTTLVYMPMLIYDKRDVCLDFFQNKLIPWMFSKAPHFLLLITGIKLLSNVVYYEKCNHGTCWKELISIFLSILRLKVNSPNYIFANISISLVVNLRRENIQ